MRIRALTVLFLILVIGFTVFCGQAYASFEAHMVDKIGETLSFRDYDTFQLWETPYLYLDVPADWGIKGSFWTDPEKVEWADFIYVKDSKVWLTLDWGNGSGQTPKTPGPWTVEGFYKLSGKPNYESATTGFNYAPEPISTILFLTGGTVLVIRRLRRRK